MWLTILCQLITTVSLLYRNRERAIIEFHEGMLTLELSLYVLEIPHDVYTTLGQNLIGCTALSQEKW